MVGFLRDYTFQYAILGSFIWHFFWLFVINVDIHPRTQPGHKDVRIHFLGPVLTDETFNLIVETKPELSKTSYEPPEEVVQELEPDIKPMGRMSPGDLVSVPLGRSTWSHLKGALKTSKERPRRVFYEKFPIDIVKSPYPITGELATRGIFQIPDGPKPQTADLLPNVLDGLGESEFEILVNPQGKVVQVDNTVSSGNPEVDLIWQNYLKKWQFMPVVDEFSEDKKGKVRIPPTSKESP